MDYGLQDTHEWPCTANCKVIVPIHDDDGKLTDIAITPLAARSLPEGVGWTDETCSTRPGMLEASSISLVPGGGGALGALPGTGAPLGRCAAPCAVPSTSPAASPWGQLPGGEYSTLGPTESAWASAS